MTRHTARRRTQVRSLLVGLLIFATAGFLWSQTTQRVFAATQPATNVNIVQRQPFKLLTGFGDLPYGTCQGTFVQQQLSVGLLNQEVGGIDWNLAVSNPTEAVKRLTDNNYVNFSPPGIVATNDTPMDSTMAQYLVSHVDQTVSVIQFSPSPAGSDPVNGFYSGNAGACTGNVLVPVSTFEWRGFQYATPVGSGANAPTNQYLDFTLPSDAYTSGTPNIGKLSLYNLVNGGNNFLSLSSFVLNGKPSLGGVDSVGTIQAQWLDAGHIEITQGNDNGEVYQKPTWDTATVNGKQYSYYFLESSNNRSSMTMGSSSRFCTNPLPINSGCAGGQTNCVPFIAVDKHIDFNTLSPAGVSDLQNRINQSAVAQFYDYDSACGPSTAQDTIQWNPGTLYEAWFYYSAQNDAFAPVFTSGATNESHYITSYSSVSQGVYKGGTAGCDAYIHGTPPSPSGLNRTNPTFQVTWDLYNANCNTPTHYGTLKVLAIGGQDGESGYQNSLDVLSSQNGNAAPLPPTLCESLGGFSLDWVVCKVIDAAQDVIGGLDNVINQQLTLGGDNSADGIFSTGSAAEPAYRGAWNAFRVLALGVIAIAGVVMVVSQAAGVEILDAYTIRKTLPKILIAAIAITLSWPIMQFLIVLSNDLGNGVRSIIYQPFNAISQQKALLGGGSGIALTLLGTGGALAFGWLGLLSFVLTGLLAVLVGFAVIVFRQMLVIFLVVMAPFAIACYVLPNTHKLWVVWRDAFIGVLLAFVIISAMIATGRVFAVTSFYASNGGTMAQIIAIVAYFAPYFLISKAFSWAGGFMAQVGGFVNDRSRGAFDRLKKFRAKQPAQRYGAFKQGELWHGERRGPLGSIARLGNRLGSNVGLGTRGHFGIGDRGRAARANRESTQIADTLRNNPALAELANYDDANAVLALSGGTVNGAQAAARELFTQNGVYDETRANAAISSARVFLGKDGRKNATAALQTVAQNKSRAIRPGRTDIVQRGIARIAGNDVEQQQALSYMYQYHSRSAGGRTDLGGDWMAAQSQARQAVAVAAANGATQAQQRQIYNQTVSDLTMMDGVGRTELSTLVRGHTNQVKQLVGDGTDQGTLERMINSADADHRVEAATRILELQRALPYANADSQGLINDFFARNGIDASGTRIQVPAGTNQQGQPVTRALTLEEQLAQRTAVGGAPQVVSASELSARARVYDQPQPQGTMPGGPGAINPN